MTVNPIDKVLEFAIANEEQAAAFYAKLAEKARNPQMKQVFQEFVAEELSHKAKLLEIKKGSPLPPLADAIETLGLADNLREDDIDLANDMDYQEALVLAMRSEKAAYRLYSTLADAVRDHGVKELFMRLAQEEARHKLRFELEYDDAFLKEN